MTKDTGTKFLKSKMCKNSTEATSPKSQYLQIKSGFLWESQKRKANSRTSTLKPKKQFKWSAFFYTKLQNSSTQDHRTLNYQKLVDNPLRLKQLTRAKMTLNAYCARVEAGSLYCAKVIRKSGANEAY